MDEDERNLLERTAKLSEENNIILRRMQRTARVGTIMSIIYWIFIIGAGLGLYYYISPYIDDIQDAYGSVRNAFQQFDNVVHPNTQQ